MEKWYKNTINPLLKSGFQKLLRKISYITNKNEDIILDVEDDFFVIKSNDKIIAKVLRKDIFQALITINNNYPPPAHFNFTVWSNTDIIAAYFVLGLYNYYLRIRPKGYIGARDWVHTSVAGGYFHGTDYPNQFTSPNVGGSKYSFVDNSHWRKISLQPERVSFLSKMLVQRTINSLFGFKFIPQVDGNANLGCVIDTIYGYYSFPKLHRQNESPFTQDRYIGFYSNFYSSYQDVKKYDFIGLAGNSGFGIEEPSERVEIKETTKTGGFRVGLKTITSDYKITKEDYAIKCDTSNNSISIKMPKPDESWHGQVIKIKKISPFNTVSIEDDNGLIVSLLFNNQMVELIADGNSQIWEQW